MRSIGVFLSLSLTAAVAFAQAEATRNPFLPSAPASAPAANTPAPRALNQPYQKGAVTSPLTLPPSLPALVVPPVPSGLRLPPVVPLKGLPAGLPGHDSTKAPSPSQDPAQPPDSPDGTSDKGTTPDVFLSRVEIEKSRSACKLELKSPTKLRASSDGETLRVSFANPTGRNCFMGLQSDRVWAAVRGAGATAVEVDVQPNPTSSIRKTKIVIASANDRWTLDLTQAAGAEDLEEIELEPTKAE